LNAIRLTDSRAGIEVEMAASLPPPQRMDTDGHRRTLNSGFAQKTKHPRTPTDNPGSPGKAFVNPGFSSLTDGLDRKRDQQNAELNPTASVASVRQ
jgi:hypothetical protein